jgi:phospholipid/cholesterol/gamma-HCH transport system substrate-binding protein
METDKHYFLEGLFVIGFVVAATFAFIWLSKSGHRDDVIYRIHFAESVSGLSIGDPVKFEGVDVGTVKSMALDPSDPRLVAVEVRLRREAPVKTDTRASLKLKGITGVVFVELTGGSPEAQRLSDAAPAGQVPEIASEKSTLTSIVDALPKVIEKFSAVEIKANKVLTDIGQATGTVKEAAGDIKETTAKVKENPSLLLRRPPKAKAESEPAGSNGTAATKETAKP